jgi:predicted esterase
LPSGGLIASLLLTTFCHPAEAQDQSAAFQPGELSSDITSVHDPDQRYAVFIPSSYNQRDPHPIMFLMDPRGRAMIPLELFRRAAEDYGFILMSSYNTLSDDATAFEQNDRALSAMLADSDSLLRVDDHRLYLVGFSGTAHYSWYVAPSLDGRLAGIVGVGGGLPAYSKSIQMGMAMEHPFAFFAIAGTGDFNYDGVKWLDEALDTTRVQHRFVAHSGGHEWPSEEIAYGSVQWLHLQAMRSGFTGTDQGYVRRLYEAAMDEAERLDRSDDEVGALRRYREIEADYEVFDMGKEAAKRHARLASDPDVLEERRRRDLISRDVQLYKVSVQKFAREYDRTATPVAHAEALRRLNIKELQRRLDDRDSQTSSAARRMLASAYANTSFYQPRRYMEAKDFERAAAVLRIAAEIYPDVPYTCYRLAQATAQIGRQEEAIDALTCSAQGDFLSRESVEQDPLLDPIRNSPGYEKVLDLIGKSDESDEIR